MSEDDRPGKFDERLMCFAVKLIYDYETKEGILIMDEGNSVHMPGVIQVFTQIDNDVKRINTFAEDKQDTFYMKNSKGAWDSYYVKSK